MDIKLVKLITGEEIVCEFIGPVDNVTEGKWNHIKNCIMFIPQKDEESGRVGISPIAYPQFAKRGEVLTVQPVFVCEPDEKIVDAYKQIWSPIKIPSPGLKLPDFE
jgi:hypothetical protein